MSQGESGGSRLTATHKDCISAHCSCRIAATILHRGYLHEYMVSQQPLLTSDTSVHSLVLGLNFSTVFKNTSPSGHPPIAYSSPLATAAATLKYTSVSKPTLQDNRLKPLGKTGMVTCRRCQWRQHRERQQVIGGVTSHCFVLALNASTRLSHCIG